MVSQLVFIEMQFFLIYVVTFRNKYYKIFNLCETYYVLGESHWGKKLKHGNKYKNAKSNHSNTTKE